MKAIQILSLFIILFLPVSLIGQLSTTIDSLIAANSKENEPGGVVMVARKGDIIYKRAFGMASLELNVPVNDSMIFWIGSNTKQFTAVAILQLVEKGKLQIRDTLGKFIPLAPYPVSSITLQQLLSHTSGIVSTNETEVKKLLNDGKTDNIIRMDAAPGSKWEYNNTTFSILGFIIEKVSGKSYQDYIRENIFKPAGMLHSYIDDEVSVIKNRAPGYRHIRMRFQHSRPSGRIGAAGGIMSTIGDLFKWNEALKSGTLLKQETLQQAYVPQKLINGDVTTYGFGWHIEELRGSPTHRHGGLVPGYTSETLYLPQEDVYIVILTNSEISPFPIIPLSRIIAALFIGKPYDFKETSIDKNELKKFIGVYENKFGEVLNITVENAKLVFQRPNGGKFLLGYAGNNEFYLDRDFLRVHFTTSQIDKVASLKFSRVDLNLTEWFKRQRPLLKLSSERIQDSVLKEYPGKYFLQGNDTITIYRDGPNLYYKTGTIDLLLAAEDSTHFFSTKNDLKITFIKDSMNTAAIVVIQNKKSKRYIKVK